MPLHALHVYASYLYVYFGCHHTVPTHKRQKAYAMTPTASLPNSGAATPFSSSSTSSPQRSPRESPPPTGVTAGPSGRRASGAVAMPHNHGLSSSPTPAPTPASTPASPPVVPLQHKEAVRSASTSSAESARRGMRLAKETHSTSFNPHRSDPALSAAPFVPIVKTQRPLEEVCLGGRRLVRRERGCFGREVVSRERRERWFTRRDGSFVSR